MNGKPKGFQFWTIIIIVVAAFMNGCTTTANYEKILNSWVGIHVDNLVSTWGPPQKSFKLSDESTVIEYIRSGVVPIGGYLYTVPQTTYSSGNINAYSSSGNYAYGSYSGTSTTYVTQRTPIYNIPLSCVTRFIVDPNNIVRSWHWQGNNCKALPPKSDIDNLNKTSKVNSRDPIYSSVAIIKTYAPPIDESKPVKSHLDIVYLRLDKADLLSEPGFSSKVLESIEKDMPLQAVVETDYWVNVTTPNGNTGWVAKNWLKKNNGIKDIDQMQPQRNQTNRLKFFLFSYGQAFESKDLDKFSGFFTPDATENNKNFHELLPTYRKNMEMIESFNYRIELDEYSIHPETGNVKIRGKFFTQYILYGEALKEKTGNISMDLIENGESYLVKRLHYTSGFEKETDRQPQWGPWIKIEDKE